MRLAFVKLVRKSSDYLASPRFRARSLHDDALVELPLHRPGRSAQVRDWLGSAAPEPSRLPVPISLAVALAAWVAVACSVLGS